MLYTPLFYYNLSANAYQRWNKIRLNNDGLRHNKTIESFSSSHSYKFQCMLLESWDVLFLILRDRIPSGREYYIETREYRKINFHQYHLEVVYFFFIKLSFPFKFFSMVTIYFIWIIWIRLMRKRYPIQIQKFPIIRPDWTPKSGSCTPLVCLYICDNGLV